jgi:hypothetical protein
MQVLRDTGMINHPEMVRGLARIAKMLREPAGSSPSLSAVPRDIGDRRPTRPGGNLGRDTPRVRDPSPQSRSQRCAVTLAARAWRAHEI